MTFGYGSPGFDPFYCPPVSAGNVSSTICIDVIDYGLLVLASAALIMVVGYALRKQGDESNTEN